MRRTQGVSHNATCHGLKLDMVQVLEITTDLKDHITISSTSTITSVFKLLFFILLIGPNNMILEQSSFQMKETLDEATI